MNSRRKSTMHYALFIIFSYGYLLDYSSASPRLIFANRKDVRLVDAEISSAKRRPTNSTVLLSGLTDAAALDFLYAVNSNGQDRSMFCWSDVSSERISCASQPQLSLSNAKVLVSGVESPDGLAIDWITKKLYWTDSKKNRLEVCHLADGSHRKVLYWTDLDQPRALALHPRSGYIYWTDWGDVPKIERAGMNGDLSTRSVVISEQIMWPNGLTIDEEEDRLYWVDANLHYIHSANLDGSDRLNLREGGGISHPFAISVYGDQLYWTDWQNRSVLSCNKYNCDSVVKVASNLYYPMDIHVFEPRRQSSIDKNPCEINNGGCSHLCLLAPDDGINCACPTGVKLLEDGHTCANGARKMIFLARSNFDLRMISLDTTDYTPAVLPVKRISHAITVDFDPVEHYVYWTDDELRLIQRARLDGSDQQVVVSVEVFNPDGIAIDWVSRNLYWTDTGTDRIEMCRLNGTSRRVVISDGLSEPRAIAVDSTNGWIYWTDWGKPAKIERAAMDGSLRQVLVNDSIHWPNGISVDFKRSKLVWADAKLDRIERCNYDGSEREVLLDINPSHIFGFDITGDYMYWTDWQRRRLERIRLVDIETAEREVILDRLSDLMGIRTISMSPEDEHNDRNISITNACSLHNGYCSHLCLIVPYTRTSSCACAVGMELLPDNRTCIVPEAFLLFSQQTTIQRSSIEYTQKDTTQLPIHYLSNVTALDIDVRNGFIYFSDADNGTIRRSYINGSSVSHILELDKASAGSIALDWISDNIYFVENIRNRIEVFNVHNSARRVLIWNELGQPKHIALHPAKGYLYWTDWNYGGIPVIGRASLDGSNQLFVLSDIGRCSSITVNQKNSRLYWINHDRRLIQSAGLNGEDLQTLYAGVNSPVALNVYGSYMYWYDSVEQAIYRLDRTNTSNLSLLQSNIHSMNNLIVHHKSRQTGWSNCLINNGGCEYFCFSTGRNNRAHCGCPTHYKLNKDNKTCSAPSSFLLVSERAVAGAPTCQQSKCKEMQIMRLVDHNMPDVALPVGSVRSVKRLEYDFEKNIIYWIDGKLKSVRRSAVRDNGADPKVETFLSGDSTISPSSMVIDPYTRFLYWSDSNSNIINVTSLKKSPIGVIFRQSRYKPLNLAINALKGHLYIVTEMEMDSQTPFPQSVNKVLRTTLDGNNIHTVVDKGQGITAITVDIQTDRIFYSEFSTKTIKSCTSSGNDTRTLVTDARATLLTIYNDKLYYTVDSSNHLFYTDKNSGRNSMLVVRPSTADITDIHAVNAYFYSNRERRRHPCAVNNGDCSHICYINERGVKQCGCPKHLVLHENQLDCETPPTCKPNQFTCESGKAPCILMTWRCDGEPECEDGSDEKNCSPELCEADQFKCTNGKCVASSLVCNKVADCSDSSDEKGCCLSDQFMCNTSRRCISSTRVGNSKCDCKDCSDERPQPPLSPVPVISSNPYAISVVLSIIFVVILFIIAFIVWRCHKRTTNLRQSAEMAAATTTMLTLHDGTNAMVITTGMADVPSHQHVDIAATSDPTTTASTSAVGAYDRNHVTGASSSSSSVTGQHGQGVGGFNPPPSPVTERSAFIRRSDRDRAGSISSNTTANLPLGHDDDDDDRSTIRSARPLLRYHRQHVPTSAHSSRSKRVPAPPTTPISTCEDSDPSLVNYALPHTAKARVKKRTNKKYHLLHSAYSIGVPPTNEPYPPPPTPAARSHVHYSEDETAPASDCPPSPSTVRSFRSNYNPYPPPPSPEPDTSDNNS